MVRTRFAPSPTGYLHIGGVRTALFAWLVARQASGKFILRIEDTDRSRHVEESEQYILQSLEWLGLKWDEGPDIGGPHAPYRQSERLDIYKKWAEKLMQAGRAYADPYSPRELEALRSEATKARQPFLFRDHRPDNPPNWDGKRPLRFKSEPKSYNWQDEVMGELKSSPEAIDDYIIIKSDGFPTYNFAHIIDDHLMQVSHIIRSQEFLSSVPKYLNLYEALAIEPPKLATLPYVMAPGGQTKLSKRHGAKDILDYKRDGYLPEALINFLASLGWNDGSNQETFSIDELIKKFSLSRVHRGGAKIDEKRLEWLNGYWIRQKTIDELYELSESFWPASSQGKKPEYKKKVLLLVQERLKHFSELPELTNFFFEERAPNLNLIDSNQQLADLGRQEQVKLLKIVLENLEHIDFSEEKINSALNNLLQETDQRPSVLFSLIRIAVTWEPASPSLSETLSLLGKDSVFKRLKSTINALDSTA